MAKNIIITCMKNEGPFILEWVAHHLAVGFDHFVVYTNDCDDGTVALLDALSDAGIVTRFDNPYLKMKNPAPQRGALKHAQNLDLVRDADWVLGSDVDEFVNIHVGDGTLEALTKAAGHPDALSMQWRLFGSAGIDTYSSRPITEQHLWCAPELCPRPVQAWGVKTLFRPKGFKSFGVHRPKNWQGAAGCKWVNGSGVQVAESFLESGWRFGTGGYGYDLVTLNHYSVRNAESYLVKKDRGRVNHVNRDQGGAYWLRMNFNMERNTSMLEKLPALQAKQAELRKLPNVEALHNDAVKHHRAKIKVLKNRDDLMVLYDDITSTRSKVVSRFLNVIDPDAFNHGVGAVPLELLKMLETVPTLDD
ncbi:glycosyltransferase family 2 protein [Roseobacter sp.]|uniref:glycosyltransferase family 2 protein n=1 Tax=Roseobacter sp. TaxID=1907202 RepID=UPI003296EAB7